MAAQVWHIDLKFLGKPLRQTIPIAPGTEQPVQDYKLLALGAKAPEVQLLYAFLFQTLEAFLPR